MMNFVPAFMGTACCWVCRQYTRAKWFAKVIPRRAMDGSGHNSDNLLK